MFCTDRIFNVHFGETSLFVHVKAASHFDIGETCW